MLITITTDGSPGGTILTADTDEDLTRAVVGVEMLRDKIRVIFDAPDLQRLLDEAKFRFILVGSLRGARVNKVGRLHYE